jgi:hypothetical protein
MEISEETDLTLEPKKVKSKQDLEEAVESGEEIIIEG